MQQVGSCQTAGVSCNGPLCAAFVSSGHAAAIRAGELLPYDRAAMQHIHLSEGQIVCQMMCQMALVPAQAAPELQVQPCLLVQGATMDERARLQQHLRDLRAGPLQLQELGNQHLVPLQLWGLCLRAVDGSGLDEGASEGYLEHLWDLLLLQVR